jgi:hypothetical protein
MEGFNSGIKGLNQTTFSTQIEGNNHIAALHPTKQSVCGGAVG